MCHNLSDFVLVVPEWADPVLKSFGVALQVILTFLLGYTGGIPCTMAPFPLPLFSLQKMFLLGLVLQDHTEGKRHLVLKFC